MSLEWSLEIVDPFSHAQLDERVFCCHPYDLSELDLILTGRDDGPLLQLVNSVPEPKGTPEEVDRWIRDGYPPCICTVEAVQRCSDEMRRIGRTDYASIDAVLTKSLRQLRPEDQQWFYDDLANEADRLRAFIAKAAELHCAIRFNPGW